MSAVMPCRVESDLRTYELEQERAEQAQERYDHACHEHALYLLGTPAYAVDLTAICNAIVEADDTTTAALKRALAWGPESFGCTLVSAAKKYMEAVALRDARQSISKEDFYV